MKYPAFISFVFFAVIALFSLNPIQTSFAQSCKPSTKYSNCNEDMPEELRTFQDKYCKDEINVSPGVSCLNAYETWFEDKLKASKPDDYQKFMEAKRIQDSGDSQACLRYSNGVLKRPREDFLTRTNTIKCFIIATAKYYGIPPEAISCAIGGDATTTSQSYPNQGSYYDSMIQDQPVIEAKNGLMSKGIEISNPPKPYACELDVNGNPKFDKDSKLIDKLGKNNKYIELDMEKNEIESIRNAAMILRHAKETYKDAGFTDKDLPVEILASIYHMGAYRDVPGVDSNGKPIKVRTNWAIKTKNENRKPGMSFIGYFCERYKQVPFRYKLGLDHNI